MFAIISIQNNFYVGYEQPEYETIGAENGQFIGILKSWNFSFSNTPSLQVPESKIRLCPVSTDHLDNMDH